MGYRPPTYPFVRPPELSGTLANHPVVIVGAGPVGLACAIDLALHGVAAVVLDDNDTVSAGSRAICYAKRTLEILDRLGCGDAVADRGVSWQHGKVFFRDRLAYQFDLQPEAAHRRPAFVNLQQYHLEEALVARCVELGVDVRWRNRVDGVESRDDGVTLTVETPDGSYALHADFAIAADGARSTLRERLGLDWKGQVFRDRFLIADVRMQGAFPTERWFWFDPPFHRNQSVLLHRQADDVWRIDFQLGWDADPDEERKPERVRPRIRAMLGDDHPFELEWVSVYTFQCRRLDRFVHGRVIFVGDAAHQVSPFGARGANSGIQDVDNLAWKLARVLRRESPVSLLDSYDAERIEAADENIVHSTRSTDFITPKSGVSRVFRDAVLDLAVDHPFARALVNSGRLSLPTCYRPSPMFTRDTGSFDAGPRPGAPAVDAPILHDGRDGWLLSRLGGTFELLLFLDEPVSFIGLSKLAPSARLTVVLPAGARAPSTIRAVVDRDGLVRRRYGARDRTLYLLRPDQHVAARWHVWAYGEVAAALFHARGLSGESYDGARQLAPSQPA
ncbi:MAG: FAD-dependent oxidoreductase [Burkholderiales bacterium]|nr:FAD-dependent oxidoreductase [Burkholderiales bacterium]